jgi:MFS family permease
VASGVVFSSFQVCRFSPPSSIHLTDHQTAIAAVGSWFLKHRALAFGIMVSGSSLGGVVLPIMIQHLLPKIGFGWTIRVTAFLMLGLLVFGNLTLKSRLPPSKKPLKLKDFISPFKEIPFVLLVFAAFFVYLGGFLPFNFIITQARAQGMSNDLSGYLVPIVNAARLVPFPYSKTRQCLTSQTVHSVVSSQAISVIATVSLM